VSAGSSGREPPGRSPLAERAAITDGTGGLKRALGLRDLVLFNLVAIISLRWLNTAAKSGPSAITLWLLAALLFFVPQGLAVAQLSARYPSEGGIYSWTKQRFGEGHAFLCGWCYWIVNVLYYPQLLMTTAVIATYAVGLGNSGLGDSWYYVLPTTLIALWIAVGFNVIGVSTGKWLQNVGGSGAYATGAILVFVGIAIAVRHHPANAFSWHALVPHFTSLPTVNLWATIAFAFAGMELSATLGGEIKDPRRTLPRAVYLSTPLVAGLYIVGTVAVLWLVPVPSINIVSGFLQGIETGTAQIGHWLWWVAPLAAATYVLGTVGGVGAWLSGPARVALMIGLDRYFPRGFSRIHPRWGTPYVAILVQAVIASGLLLLYVLGRGTTVERVYLILQDTQTLIYFLPFVYLFLCLLVEPTRVPGLPTVVPGGTVGKAILAIAGLFVTVFAMAIACIPPESGQTLVFECKVVGGALAFMLVGGAFYWRRRPRGG
jgi:glutamate:GABA antiporter